MIDTLVNQHWHQLPAADAADLLGVDREAGLTDAEAASRLATFGPNRVTARKERRALVRFLLQFHQERFLPARPGRRPARPPRVPR